MRIFSPAQIVGYISFVLGTAAFVQRTDRRLKILLAAQSLIYALHFLLLGNLTASTTALISSFRSALTVRYRSVLLAFAVIAVNIGVAAAFAKSGPGWLPVIGSCAATLALFTMRGIPLRSVLLGSTLLWLTNNILCGSIGGTLLESLIAIMNFSTIIRLMRSGFGAEQARVGRRLWGRTRDPQPGNVMRKRLPPRSAGSYSRRPPDASTALRAIASPRPAPREAPGEGGSAR
jgi:hypothetical protein